MEFRVGDRVTVRDMKGLVHCGTICRDGLTDRGFVCCIRDDGESPNIDGAWYAPPDRYELLFRPESSGCVSPGTVVEAPHEVFNWEAHKSFFK